MPERPVHAGFGIGRLHHLFSGGDRERVVHAALDAGFRHFDTAPAYGDGLAERELGRILGRRRDGVVIVTKFGIPFRAIGELPMPLYFAVRAAGKAVSRSFGANYGSRDFSPKALVASLDQSLRRLRTDHVDILLVHEPMTIEQFRALGDTWAELERQQKQGRVRRFGVSGPTRLLLDAEKEGLVPAAAVRMVTMDDDSCALPPVWFAGREVFVFNIVKHLRREHGAGRIDTGVLVERFFKAFPAGRPILASHNLDEIKRMGVALAPFAGRGVGAAT